MTSANPALDPARCPLCGSANACAMTAPAGAGAGTGSAAGACWCMTAHVAPEALARVPAPARGQACLCAVCAGAQATLPQAPSTPNRPA
ncbi:cysteine-rich CWC family protein [Ottowia sp.]|uniref:cysteine-rich CWC family protein n=1 Tax=Ottowia sp. TaxID=1898956 RepID=UPI003A8B8D7A